MPAHDLDLRLRGHRADVHVVLVRIALAELPGQRDHLLGEGPGHALVNVHALDRGAGLPRVRERAPGDLLRGGVQVRVGEHDGRILSPELQHAGDHLLGSREVHLLPGGDRAGEYDHLHPAPDQLRAHLAPALHHAEEPAGQARLLQESARLLHHDGGELARLHDHRVAGHQRGGGVAHRDRKRIVPGRDDADHPAGVEAQVRLLVREQVQRDLLVGEHLLGMGRIPVHRVRDRQHLHEEGLVAGLPVLPRDVVAELLGAGEQQLLEPEQHGAPFRDGLARPLSLRRAGLLHGFPDVGSAGDAHLAEQLAGPRFVDGQRALGRD